MTGAGGPDEVAQALDFGEDNDDPFDQFDKSQMSDAVPGETVGGKLRPAGFGVMPTKVPIPKYVHRPDRDPPAVSPTRSDRSRTRREHDAPPVFPQ